MGMRTRKSNAAPRKNLWSALRPGPANYRPLSPIVFLLRAAEIYPERVAAVHGRVRHTYARFCERAQRLASALHKVGVRRGAVVSAMLPNVPAMLEAHFGVPMLGAVLNTINTRLDAETVAYILQHGEAKVLITDRVFAGVVGPALAKLKRKPFVVDVDDPAYTAPGDRLGQVEYEDFLRTGKADFEWSLPESESQPIALNYTSGTTGRPKGVVYHHRGTFLESVGNIMAWAMPAHPVYLWTLPMFHCNGWCFPWSVSVVAGTHICLRWVRAKAMYDALAEHKVTHLCGAPIVMSTLINALPEERRELPRTVEFITAAAPPPEAVLAGMADAGFNVTHVYGLTETYCPAVGNEWNAEWEAPARDTSAG